MSAARQFSFFSIRKDCHNKINPAQLSVVSIKFLAKVNITRWGTSHKKVPNCLSRCHTKRRMGERAYFLLVWHRLLRVFFGGGWDQNFFSYHPKVGVIPKWRTHASFGMTPTLAIRDLFAWHRPNFFQMWILPGRWGLQSLKCHKMCRLRRIFP